MSDDKIASAWELRRALELLANKLSPPHLPAARLCKLADLLDSGMTGLDLRDVNLSGAWLRGLDFGASRLPARLAGADLGEADLSSCDLHSEQLEQTRLLRSILPPGLTPPTSALSNFPPRPAPLTTLFGHVRAVLSLAAFPDGRFLSGSNDGTIHLWSPDQDYPLRIFSDHEGVVSCLAVLPNGRFLSGGSGGKIYLWSPDQGQSLRTFPGNQDGVSSFAALPDGRFLSGGTMERSASGVQTRIIHSAPSLATMTLSQASLSSTTAAFSRADTMKQSTFGIQTTINRSTPSQAGQRS